MVCRAETCAESIPVVLSQEFRNSVLIDRI
jgi:hypothetical protein